MIGYVARRIGLSVFVLFVSSILIFVVLRVIPGDPTIVRAQLQQTPEDARRELHRLGLDRPLHEQYMSWIGGALRGEFGESYFSGRSTTRLIRDRLEVTVELALASVTLGLLMAMPAAILSARRPNSLVDAGLRAFATAGIALPSVWLGMLIVALFSVRLGWFPTRGYVSVLEDPLRNLRHLALPTMTLAVILSAMFYRFLRASLLETMSADFTRTAYGKGLLWSQVIRRHVLPNAFLPTLTWVGLVTGYLLGGAVIIEYLFGLPGLGALVVDSIAKRDYAVIQGVVLLASSAFVATTLLVDLASLVLDPRLRSPRT